MLYVEQRALHTWAYCITFRRLRYFKSNQISNEFSDCQMLHGWRFWF